MMDTLRLHGIVLFAHMGVRDAEREVGQKIHIDIEMAADFRGAARSDALSDAIDYEKVYRLVEGTVASRRFKLLESLAGELADALLEAFPAEEVSVKVQKPNVPFQGTLSSVEVELRRHR
jgi:dihydroneopterin aldolase